MMKVNIEHHDPQKSIPFVSGKANLNSVEGIPTVFTLASIAFFAAPCFTGCVSRVTGTLQNMSRAQIHAFIKDRGG
jgi:NAD-dependent DNA ligase